MTDTDTAYWGDASYLAEAAYALALRECRRVS